jgi:hypothetical protein
MAADLLATDPDMHRDLPLDAVGDRRLHSRILLYLDLLEASQDLASECFHQDGLENAQNLLDGPIEKLLATVGAVGADQTALSVLGAEFGKVVVPRWRFAERRKFYLQARLTAARSKQPLTEKIVADVEQKYVLARGGSCWGQRWREKVTSNPGMNERWRNSNRLWRAPTRPTVEKQCTPTPQR